MLTGELRSKIDGVWNAFWAGGIANPLEVIEQITYLLFMRGLDEAHNGEVVREVPYLAVSNVQDKFLDLTVVKTIEASEPEIQRYRLKKNDLLLTEGGDPDKLGRGTLWADELAESIHQNHIFRVRVTSDATRPFFLIWLLGSPYGKAYFLRSAKQTTGIASINKGQLSDFPVILPSIDLQKEFELRANRVERALAISKDAAKAVDGLFFSLQDRAFAGGLA